MKPNGLFRQSLNGTGNRTEKNGSLYIMPNLQTANLCGTGTCTYTLELYQSWSRIRAQISSVCISHNSFLMTLQVVLLDLEVFAEISSSPAGQKYPPKSISDNDLTLPSPVKHAVESSHHMNAYFTKFLVSLLRLFRTDRTLLEDRGSFIIR